MKLLISLIALISQMAVAEQKIDVQVKGMVCAFCAQGIEKKFKAMPEIKSVSVDLDAKLVSLEIQKDKKISEEVLTSTIKNAGFEVVSIKNIENKK